MLRDESNLFYYGQFDTNAKHGYGMEAKNLNLVSGDLSQQSLLDCTIFKGFFKNGVKNGFCSEVNIDSIYSYTGEVLDSYKAGFGKLEERTRVYIGHF